MSRTCAHHRPNRRGRVETGVLPDDLYDYAKPQTPSRVGRPVKHDLSGWTVTDDWPEHIPVTETEVDVFEAWFGDLFDELFGPCR
ncbi:hypothetical protein ACUSIJ_25515 [Pseudochelatococcus sp. B33]